MQKYLSIINRGFTVISGACIAIIIILTVTETVMRFAFKHPTLWTIEITQYLLLFSVFLPAAYTLQVGGHIRLDLVLNVVSPQKRRILENLASIMGAIFCWVLLWQFGRLFLMSYRIGFHSATPLHVYLVPIYGVMVVAVFILCIQYTVQTISLVMQTSRSEAKKPGEQKC